MTQAVEWVRLDPRKANHGACYGARVRGPDSTLTLLELARGSVAIVGHMSCGSRADALRHAARCYASDGDRTISAAEFTSWRT